GRLGRLPDVDVEGLIEARGREDLPVVSPGQRANAAGMFERRSPKEAPVLQRLTEAKVLVLLEIEELNAVAAGDGQTAVRMELESRRRSGGAQILPFGAAG